MLITSYLPSLRGRGERKGERKGRKKGEKVERRISLKCQKEAVGGERGLGGEMLKLKEHEANLQWH